MKIVTVTINPALDISTSVKQVVPEKKLRCSKPDYDPGGGGLNVSRAIKKLGGNSLAVFTSGGAAGSMLEELLEKEKINALPIEIKENTRESFTVSEESGDQQFRFVLPGPEVNEKEWKQFLEGLKDLDEKPGYIIGSGSLSPGVPEDFFAKIASYGKDLGAKVIIDTSGEALKHAIEENVFLIKPNMNEVRYITNKEIKDESDLEESLNKVIEKGKVENIVVSLGSGGAMIINKNGCKHYRAPAVPIKSKVGAGDSTVAGMVLAFSRGMDIYDSVKFGIAAGSSAVMTPGTELCRKDDTERLFEKIKMNSEK
jgi:6-phosphofructokinase 2